MILKTLWISLWLVLVVSVGGHVEHSLTSPVNSGSNRANRSGMF